MMTLHHLGVLARCLGLQLDGWALPVQELSDLLAHEARLAVGDQHFHGTKVPDPVRRDRLDEVFRLAPFQQRACCPPDSFIEQVADHQLAVEQYIPLNHLVEVMGESHCGERLRRRPCPHPADTAGVDDLLDEFERLLRGAGNSQDLNQLGTGRVPKPDVQSPERAPHYQLIGRVQQLQGASEIVRRPLR